MRTGDEAPIDPLAFWLTVACLGGLTWAPSGAVLATGSLIGAWVAMFAVSAGFLWFLRRRVLGAGVLGLCAVRMLLVLAG